MELIKIVNYGKAGTYLYSAIIKMNDKYFFTESVFCKTKEDKKKIVWNNQKIISKM